MNPEAQKRIQAARQEKATTLDLGGLKLKQIPPEIADLIWLESLDLSHNQFIKIEGLDRLLNLQFLDLDDNQLIKIEGLDQLVNLQGLSLGDNQFIKIEGLDQLVNLQILYLDNNQLSKIEGLDQLVNLQTLYLWNNQLSKIEGLDQLVNLQSLHFGINQLIKIEGLDQLVNLQILNLSVNQLVKIEGLDQLITLQNLSLSGNQLSKIEGLDQLGNLQSLALQKNQLSKIEGLDRLVTLQTLSLSLNQLSKIEGLDQLVNLQSLSLGHNQLVKIEGLDQLITLQTLSLSGNQLSKIKGLDQLVTLQSLSLGHNQLIDIEGLDQLVHLQSLNLDNNQIKQIEGLDQLSRLRYLEVSNNPIKELAIPTSLDQLEVLVLENTHIQALPEAFVNRFLEVPILWKNAQTTSGYSSILDQKPIKGHTFIYKNGIFGEYLKGIYVHGCHQLKQPAPEWIILGPEMVRAYFEALAEQGPEEMNEVKVLLVGDGGAGKTSLAYRLTKPKEDLPKAEERTRGIEVFDWKYTQQGKKHLVHLWDFGGQVMYDMVHQYFYSQRSLYVLMDSSRSGTNEHDSRLNQLLQSAELFGRGSQMLLIQNEHTDHKKQMDFGVLKRNYPFLSTYKSTNLQTKEGLKEVIQALKSHVAKIPGMGVVMPKKWMKVRRKIQTLAKTKSTISFSEFRNICEKQGVKEEQAQKILSKYFHQLGVFLHFQNNPSSSLSQLIILSREWATKASYKVFDSEVVKAGKGMFRQAHLQSFWPEDEFRDHHPNLLALMQEFEICFELKSSQQYLVPRMMNRMPEERFCSGEGKDKPLFFYYEYTFMPEGLLNRLSVRLHEMIGGEQGDQVWSDGVVFEEKGLIAELRELRQPDSSRIEIRVKGKDAHWMAETLIREIDRINKNFHLARLKVNTFIPCNCPSCQASEDPFFLDFREVKADLEKPEAKFHTYQCKKSRDTIHFHSLMQTISHQVLAEIEEVQKQRKIGRFAHEEEISFKGPKAVQAAERMMTQDPDGLAASVAEVGQQVAEEATKTRQTVLEEADKTRDFVKEQLADMPLIFRKNLKESQEEQLAALLGKLGEIPKGEEFSTIVAEAVQAAFQANPTQEDLLKALQEVAIANNSKADSLKVTEKLKLSLWLIPTILKYEAELPVPLQEKFRGFWKKAGMGNVMF